MEFSADPYEYKLYQMFQSCDTNQCGYLDENSLRRLCAQLELRDKGAVLIENLAKEKRTSHVTFENFKEALLNFLGTEIDGANSSDVAAEQRKEHYSKVNNDVDKICGERSLNICEDKENLAADSPLELSDREVLPKLVVGTKKYGRRSRPQIQKKLNEQSASDSDDSNDNQDYHSHRGCSAPQVKRSTSQIDIPGTRIRATAACVTESKLKRCASLPAQRNLLNQNKPKLVANKGNMAKDSLMPPITKNPLSSSAESLESPAFMETMQINSILDLWERSSIPNGRGILLALGFDNDEINIAQLNKVMEEEITNLEDEPQTALMKACLVLQTEELGNLRQFSKQQRDENAKLRADNKDANRRIALLAAEIDERHASLEDATKKEIRLLEQKHAGVVKDLTARLANDRENWSNLTSRLEAKLKMFEQDEIKLKTELELVRRENDELDVEKQKMQKQMTELLEKNIDLQNELTEMDETNHCKSRKELEKTNDDEEVLRLVEKVAALQIENCNLRDKNDELIVEVETLNHDLNKMKMKWKKLTVSQDYANPELDENEMSSSSAAVKRRGDSPSKTRLIEESPRLGKLRKCTNDASNNTCSENSDTSGEWMALNSELHNTKTSKASTQQQMEIENLRKIISELEEQLKQVKEKQQTQSPNSSLTSSSNEERCKELEASLEQMQKAYEDCEDYWQAKLTDERNLFEKERQIYEEEQQESDKKFTELMEKVREYEEQFNKDGRLSPIEEKDVLEQQYADLEAEAEEIRENARKIFKEKSQEIEALHAEIEDLKIRLGESVEILTGAYELQAETAAANLNLREIGSPANSPISYLWQQSTIQEPSKNCQLLETNLTTVPLGNQTVCVNLSTSETTIFSTTPQTVQSPIAKPIQSQTQSTQSEAGDVADCETSSTASGKSFETHSIHSNQSYQQRNNQMINKTINNIKNNSPSPTPNALKDELKRLKYFEISLKEQINDLSLQRDGLIMELQQLQEAKPVLEKAYARTCHPSLIQRVNQLELKNRHLQNAVKQQQKYTESIMQQSWRHHQIELNDLHGRLEAQGALIAEQVQRLQNADILVKDLYVENSHLTASVQMLEQQRLRANMMQQQQQRSSCAGLPGIP